MRINELLVEQQLDELGLGDVGRAAAKGVGGLAKGIGATVGGVQGAWDAAKHGYQVGRGAVGGVGAPVQAQQAAQWSAQQAQQQKDTNTAANLQNQQARLAQASQGSDAEVPQLTQAISNLDTPQLTQVKTAIDQRAKALSSTPAPSNAPGTTQTTTGTRPASPAAPQVGSKATGSDGQSYTWKGAQWVSDKTGRIASSQISKALTPNKPTSGSSYSGMPPAGNITNQPVGSNVPGRTFENKDFYSKFLGQQI